MPFKTGNWGEQAKARSVRRREYFRNYQRERYAKRQNELRSKMLQKYYQNIPRARAEAEAYHHIKIPEGQLCEDCHASLATQRHHPDYEKPLEVKFLCSSCHRKKCKVR